MIHVLLRCKVGEYARWKDGFDDLFTDRSRAGELCCRVFHSHDDDKDVVMFFEWQSEKAAKSFFGSEKWKKLITGGAADEHVRLIYLDEVRALRLSAAD